MATKADKSLPLGPPPASYDKPMRKDWRETQQQMIAALGYRNITEDRRPPLKDYVRCLAELRVLDARIDQDGSVTLSAAGTLKPHPDARLQTDKRKERERLRNVLFRKPPPKPQSVGRPATDSGERYALEDVDPEILISERFLFIFKRDVVTKILKRRHPHLLAEYRRRLDAAGLPHRDLTEKQKKREWDFQRACNFHVRFHPSEDRERRWQTPPKGWRKGDPVPPEFMVYRPHPVKWTDMDKPEATDAAR